MLITAAPEADAIFCGNDQIADGACEALAALGRRVPDDVASGVVRQPGRLVVRESTGPLPRRPGG
jgi:LacI family transcriptional regulator